jgi:hypothetical protein
MAGKLSAIFISSPSTPLCLHASYSPLFTNTIKTPNAKKAIPEYKLIFAFRASVAM